MQVVNYSPLSLYPFPPKGAREVIAPQSIPAPFGGRMSEACYIAVAIIKKWLYSLVIVILAVGFNKTQTISIAMKCKKTKKVTYVSEKTLIVAVDIGKSVHHGYMRAPYGKEVKPFPFYNNGHSFKEFWRKICCFQREQGLEKIVRRKVLCI